MTKNPRDPRMWTNRDIEEDSAGFLAAKEAYQEDQAKATEKKNLEYDKKVFTEAFVASGGNPGDASAAFKAERNRRATEAARRADQVAANESRRQMWRTV